MSKTTSVILSLKEQPDELGESEKSSQVTQEFFYEVTFPPTISRKDV